MFFFLLIIGIPGEGLLLSVVMCSTISVSCGIEQTYWLDSVLVFYIVSVTETSDMLVSNSVLVGSLPELTANQLCAQRCVIH